MIYPAPNRKELQVLAMEEDLRVWLTPQQWLHHPQQSMIWELRLAESLLHQEPSHLVCHVITSRSSILRRMSALIQSCQALDSMILRPRKSCIKVSCTVWDLKPLRTLASRTQLKVSLGPAHMRWARLKTRAASASSQSIKALLAPSSMSCQLETWRAVTV